MPGSFVPGAAGRIRTIDGETAAIANGAEAYTSGSVYRGVEGRSGQAIARAFVAKAVYNRSATRRIRGWESQREIPHESAFSRAFAEFAESELPRRLHAALIEETQQRQADRAYLAGFHANGSPPSGHYAEGNEQHKDPWRHGWGINCILTWRMVSQAALPLAESSALRATNLLRSDRRRLRFRSDPEAQRRIGTCADYRHQSAPGHGAEGGVTSGKETL